MTDAERVRMNDLALQIQREKSYQRFEELTRELFTLVAIKEHRFFEHQASPARVSDKGWKLLPAVANRLIKQLKGIDNVEIKIPNAEYRFNKIRIENSFTDHEGSLLAIQPGAHLEVKLEASASTFTKRQPTPRWSRSQHRRQQQNVNDVATVPVRSPSVRKEAQQRRMCLYCGKPISNKQLRPSRSAHASTLIWNAGRSTNRIPNKPN